MRKHLTKLRSCLMFFCSVWRKGFTLIELLVVLALLGIIFVFTVPYFLSSHEKNILQSQRDEILKALKLAQQRSIAAEKGLEYGVEFTKNPGSFTFVFQKDLRTSNLHKRVKIHSFSNNKIYFTKLTGLPNDGNDFGLILESDNLRCEISVSKEGVIDFTPVKKRPGV